MKQQADYFFHAANAGQVLAALAKGETSVDISIDLNLSVGGFSLSDEELILDQKHRLSKAELEMVAGKANRIFYLQQGRLEPLEVRDGGYCKLVPTDQAPLLEISGVKMHISKGINPFESAGRMAAQVVRKGARVLDTCSGLGYAASAALKLGAREVVSVEKSATVLALRQKNPWSQGIFDPNIRRVHADVNDYIRQLASDSFDAVIHDPPRFSLAGELYGDRFYGEIYRVLKRRGQLFHYTGNPQRIKRGCSFMDQAVRRLKQAGFSKTTKVVELMGVTACK